MKATNSGYPIYKTELLKNYNYYWEHDDIKQQEFKEALSRNKSFQNCFNPRLNLTRAIKKDIINRTTGKIPLSLVIQIYGKQGDGKSKLGIEFAKKIDKNGFSANKIFMKAEALLNYCQKAKKNDCLMLDEQAILFGEGAKRQQAEIQNIEEITRIKQIHFIYCSPTLREHMATHYTLKVIQKNTSYRITKFAFTNSTGTYYYGWGLAYIPKDEDCNVYKEYEPKKLEYVEGVLQRDSQKYSLEAKASKLLSHKDIYLARKKDGFNMAYLGVLTQELYPTLTTGEHKKIMSKAKMMLKKAMWGAKDDKQ